MFATPSGGRDKDGYSDDRRRDDRGSYHGGGGRSRSRSPMSHRRRHLGDRVRVVFILVMPKYILFKLLLVRIKLLLGF